MNFSKVAGCKVFISCISLCFNNNSSKKEIKKTILFMTALIKE